MSHDTPPRPIGPDDGNGGWGRWVMGAVIAAVIVGGGYYAWKALAPADGLAPTESAYNEEPALDAEPFEPVPPADAPDETAPPEAPTPTPAPRRRPQPPQQVAEAAPVPEMVIGVGPVDLTPMAAVDPNAPDMSGAENEIIVPAPRWVRSPSPRRLSTAYPQRALERGRAGEARIACIVADEGALDCVRVSETPANAGFGNAALRVARMYRHAPVRSDGSSAAGTPINLRVVFRVADDDRRGR